MKKFAKGREKNKTYFIVNTHGLAPVVAGIVFLIKDLGINYLRRDLDFISASSGKLQK